jgi:hypothetical protein
MARPLDGGVSAAPVGCRRTTLDFSVFVTAEAMTSVDAARATIQYNLLGRYESAR